MTLAYPAIDRSPEPALRVSRRIDDHASTLSDEAAADLLVPAAPLSSKATEAERELLYLLDMRYEQHLAQQALQELFETGSLETLQI